RWTPPLPLRDWGHLSYEAPGAGRPRSDIHPTPNQGAAFLTELYGPAPDGGGSNGLLALQHETIEIADLRDGIVAICLVQQAPVVPNHRVAGFPPMAVLEARLRRKGPQSIEAGPRPPRLHSGNLPQAGRGGV